MKQLKAFLIPLAYLFSCILFVVSKNFNGLYGQDAHEYFRYSKALLNWFQSGQNPGDYFWPVWYPIAVSLVALISHIPVLFSLQLVSILSLVAMVIIVSLWNNESENELSKTTYSLIVVGLSPFILVSGFVGMADAMSVALVLGALLSFKKYLTTLGSKWLYLFAICGAFATMTRYASAVVLLPPSLVIAYYILSRGKSVQILVCLAIVFLVCLPHLVIRYHNPLSFVQHEWINSWSPIHFFERNFVTRDGITRYKLFNLAFVFLVFSHYGFGILFLPLACFVRTRDIDSTLNRTLLTSVIIYSIFLAGIPFQNKRFLLATYPVVMLLFYPAYERLIQFVRIKRLFLLAVACVHLLIFTKIFAEYEERNLLEQELAMLVSRQPETTLYSFDMDVAISSYDTSKTIYNLWSQQYDSFEINSLVLFNEKKFTKQWQGKNPMLNWQMINNSYMLHQIAKEKNGWCLFKIERKK